MKFVSLSLRMFHRDFRFETFWLKQFSLRFVFKNVSQNVCFKSIVMFRELNCRRKQFSWHKENQYSISSHKLIHDDFLKVSLDLLLVTKDPKTSSKWYFFLPMDVDVSTTVQRFGSYTKMYNFFRHFIWGRNLINSMRLPPHHIVSLRLIDLK